MDVVCATAPIDFENYRFCTHNIYRELIIMGVVGATTPTDFWERIFFVSDYFVCRLHLQKSIYTEIFLEKFLNSLGGIQKLRWQDEVGRWFFKCQHY